MTVQPTAPPLLHDWVQWSMVAVAVIVDPFTGGYTAVVEPSSAVGEVVGCRACGEPLSESSAVTTCLGEEADLHSP